MTTFDEWFYNGEEKRERMTKKTSAKEIDNGLSKDIFEIISVKHKCGRAWRVTRNSLELLYCPYCKSPKGFKEIK